MIPWGAGYPSRQFLGSPDQFRSGSGCSGKGPVNSLPVIGIPKLGLIRFEVVSKGEEASNFPMALRETNCIQSRGQIWYLSDSVST